MRTIPFLPWTAAALVALAACSDSTGGGGTPAQVQLVSGDAQTDTAGDALPQKLVIRVVDADGDPVRKQAVRFQALEGSGSAGGGAITNGQGQAEATWTLGTKAGPQRVEAAAVDPSNGQVIAADTFTATAVPGAPTMIDRVNDQARSVAVNDTIADSLTVVLRDKYQNPVPGVTVAWAVTAGGGSVSPASVVTGANGLAKTRWIVGPTVGVQTVSATAGALTTTFQASVGPRVPVRLARVSGDGQHAAAGGQLPNPLVVQAFDARNRPVAGTAVSFFDPAVNGFVQVNTDANGIASHTPATNGAPFAITLYAVQITGDRVHFAASSDPTVDASVPLDLDGMILDARHGKAAWIEAATGRLWLMDRATGTQTLLAQAANRAWITPSGAVYDAGGTVFAWRAGTTTTLGDTTGVQVAGEYVLLRTAGGASVYNVATGGRTDYAVTLPATASLRADGDVYYVEAAALKRLSGGTATTLVPAGAFGFRGAPSVEGTYPAYVRATDTDPFQRQSQMVYWDGTQEQVLQSIDSFRQTLPSPLRDYGAGTLATNGDWLVWKVEQEGPLFPGRAHFHTFTGAGTSESQAFQNLLFYGLSPDGVAGAGSTSTVDTRFFLLFGGSRVVYVSRTITGRARRRFVSGNGQTMFLQGETMIQLSY
ncbi:MAG TPA: Ig-like domain-containing protein [Longimicrobium sp.]|nr:Ig-like domain-containing protein [Longimicrobium sp.]